MSTDRELNSIGANFTDYGSIEHVTPSQAKQAQSIISVELIIGIIEHRTPVLDKCPSEWADLRSR